VIKVIINTNLLIRHQSLSSLVYQFKSYSFCSKATQAGNASYLQGFLPTTPAASGERACAKILLKPKGTITMEFPHLMKLMAGNQFDTIYHEHFSYFSFLTAD
jgi:hypothetical protein